MTLNGVMTVILRYFTEFGKPAFQHNNRLRAQERKFTFAISSADELLVFCGSQYTLLVYVMFTGLLMIIFI